VHSQGPTAPLVGRGSERVVLREELATAVAGHGRLILIGGEAGIGKTTLANDLAAEAAQRGALVLIGHCYDLTNTPPYGPWLDLFGTISPQEPSLPVPIAFAGGRLQASIVDQAALFAEVREVFLRLTEIHPVLLVLEDLHWADPASIELLRSLAAHVTHQALLIVGTYRVDELTRQHP
jgi:predicted ATPase